MGLWQALGRDGLTRASSDEVRQLELCRYMWWARHIVVFAGFTLEIWQDGWARTQWLSGAMLVSQVVAPTSSRRAGRTGAGLVTVLDPGAFLVLSALGLAPVLVLLIGVAVLAHRGAHLDRRLRHRPILAGAAAQAARRRGEDRPVLSGNWPGHGSPGRPRPVRRGVARAFPLRPGPGATTVLRALPVAPRRPGT